MGSFETKHLVATLCSVNLTTASALYFLPITFVCLHNHISALANQNPRGTEVHKMSVPLSPVYEPSRAVFLNLCETAAR